MKTLPARLEFDTMMPTRPSRNRFAARLNSGVRGKDMDHRRALPEHGKRGMKMLGVLFLIPLVLPFAAEACPIGMLYNGNGCSPPYEYSMDDWIREKNEYLDSLEPTYREPAPSLTPEEFERLKKLQAEKDE